MKGMYFMYKPPKPPKPPKTIKIYQTKQVKSFKDIIALAEEIEKSPEDILLTIKNGRIFAKWCDENVLNTKYNEQMKRYKISLAKYVKTMKPIVKRAMKLHKEFEKYYEEAIADLYDKSEKK